MDTSFNILDTLLKLSVGIIDILMEGTVFLRNGRSKICGQKLDLLTSHFDIHPFLRVLL